MLRFKLVIPPIYPDGPARRCCAEGDRHIGQGREGNRHTDDPKGIGGHVVWLKIDDQIFAVEVVRIIAIQRPHGL